MANDTKTEAKEKMVTVFIPRDRNDKEDAIYVSVNERSFLVKKGQQVEVPECVAEVLRHRDMMLETQYQFESENAH